MPPTFIFSAFLSTLSLRRATCRILTLGGVYWHFYPRSPCGERLPSSANMRLSDWYFYPRSPCGERPDMAVSYSKGIKISIHALLAESDRFGCGNILVMSEFLSTLSLRRATMALALCFYLCWYFYPRSPCGERRSVSRLPRRGRDFYPRSPCGERLFGVKVAP